MMHLVSQHCKVIHVTYHALLETYYMANVTPKYAKLIHTTTTVCVLT